MTDLQTLESLLLQIGFAPEDFNRVRRAHTRAEAVELLASLKDRFKPAFKRKIFELHPDRTHGDPEKSKQLQILINFARDLDELKVPEENPKVIIHEVIFHNPIQRPRRSGPWGYSNTQVKSTMLNVARILAGMRPSGVNRGR